MKKITFALFATLMLCACEKPLVSEEKTSGNDGNLRVSVFEIEKTPFASLTRGEAASEICTHLNYAVYTQDGTRVK
ncbi:MAG: hypothetical protein IK075_11455, partial [Prevotella sp.]|nr:hypothetical protein [Prevotella sp.]